MWTKEEEDILAEYSEVKTPAELSLLLNRTNTEICSKRDALGLPKVDYELRFLTNLNSDLDMIGVWKGSSTGTSFRCTKGHEFVAKPTKLKSCPACSIAARKKPRMIYIFIDNLIYDKCNKFKTMLECKAYYSKKADDDLVDAFADDLVTFGFNHLNRCNYVSYNVQEKEVSYPEFKEESYPKVKEEEELNPAGSLVLRGKGRYGRSNFI